MITKLNLASKPFRNRTLPYLLALLLLVMAVVGAIISFSEYSNAISKNEVVEKDIADMTEKIAALTQKGEQVQKELTPDQKALLVAAHKLVANKSFGWSRLFADLEGVLPGSVSASRINVENVFKDGDRIKAELELGVLSRDYQSVMAMIDNMSQSGLFQAELRGQDLQKTDRLTFSEYTLHVIYTPRSGYSPVPSGQTTDLAQRQGGSQ
ncbi:MAG: hypothetical protein R2747_21475 [Pyrinomonadaceae bacterium]